MEKYAKYKVKKDRRILRIRVMIKVIIFGASTSKPHAMENKQIFFSSDNQMIITRTGINIVEYACIEVWILGSYGQA